MTQKGMYTNWGGSTWQQDMLFVGNRVYEPGFIVQLHGDKTNTSLGNSIKFFMQNNPGFTGEVHLSQPGWPGSSNLTNLKNGSHDEFHRANAQDIKAKAAAAGVTVKLLRLMVECNGCEWMEHSYFNQAEGVLYGQAFARIGAIYRQELPGILLDYCTNRERLAIGWGYPGDANCDVVSFDFYHEKQYSGNLTGAQFVAQLWSEACGLTQFFAFAEQVNKPAAFSEYSGKSTTDVQVQDFINELFTSVRTRNKKLRHAVLFNENYTGAANAYVKLGTDRPLGRAAWLQQYDLMKVYDVGTPTNPPVTPTEPPGYTPFAGVNISEIATTGHQTLYPYRGQPVPVAIGRAAEDAFWRIAQLAVASNPDVAALQAQLATVQAQLATAQTTINEKNSVITTLRNRATDAKTHIDTATTALAAAKTRLG